MVSIKSRRSIKPVSCIVHAFHGCLVRVSGDNSVTDFKGYRVDGSSGTFYLDVRILKKKRKPNLFVY